MTAPLRMIEDVVPQLTKVLQKTGHIVAAMALQQTAKQDAEEMAVLRTRAETAENERDEAQREIGRVIFNLDEFAPHHTGKSVADSVEELRTRLCVVRAEIEAPGGWRERLAALSEAVRFVITHGREMTTAELDAAMRRLGTLAAQAREPGRATPLPMRGADNHEWIVTSDPMTPMCRRCKVREGDPMADAPCTAPLSAASRDPVPSPTVAEPPVATEAPGTESLAKSASEPTAQPQD